MSRVSLVVLAVVTAACRGDDRATPPPAPATDPGLTAALTEVMTRAFAAADGARRLHREAEERRVAAAAMEPDVPVMLDDDDDAAGVLGLLAVPDGADHGGVLGGIAGGVLDDLGGSVAGVGPDATPPARPPRVTLRTSSGNGGFPADQLDAQASRLLIAVETCLTGATLDQLRQSAHPVAVSVRIQWLDDDPTVAPRVSAYSVLPIRACLEDRLQGVVADAGATYGALVRVE